MFDNGCQLWFDPANPPKSLIQIVQKVQNNALYHIAGAFRTSPIEALQFLTHIPPLHITIRKLSESEVLCIFRLPTSSEVSHRLPAPFLPSRVPRPIHIPFRWP